MDIEELKKEHMENKSNKEELQNIRDVAYKLFDELVKLDYTVIKKCSENFSELKLKVRQEFNNYFVRQGFVISKEEKDIIANFNDLKIRLHLIKEEELVLRYELNVEKKKQFYIKLRVANIYRDVIGWNCWLSSKNFPIIDKQNGRTAIALCKDENSLKNASEFLENKIQEFSKILEDVDLVKYVYTTYEKDEIDEDNKATFDTFEKLFESL